MDDFYAARSRLIPPLLWPTFAPPFSVETLETRNSDRADFHDVAVWSIRAALEEAYEAGRRAAAEAAR